MSDDTSFMVEIAHDIKTVHTTDRCWFHDNPDPKLTFGHDPTQYQQQTTTSTWQQLHTIPATGLHFKHVLWDYQVTPWLLVSSFSWDPHHPDLTSSHAVFKLPQGRLHLDTWPTCPYAFSCSITSHVQAL